MRVVFFLLALAFSADAADWPTYGHDNRRSHVSDEKLTFPLAESWVFTSPVLPQTAWTGPAKWDAYAANEGLQSMRNFDPVFFVTSVGEAVYFGSSADHGVHCLDVKNGEERWVSFADGAVRLPPTWDDGRLYYGADDGFARCLDAKTGQEIWKFRPIDDAKMIPSNGKLMSPFPVRTGVLVDEGTAYFGCSLFPWEKSYLCAVDSVSGDKRFVTEQTSVTLQGILLSSAERIYAPQGRTVPLIFSKASGSRLGDVAGTGGVYVILTPEEQIIAMPQNQKSAENVVKLTDPNNKEAILSIPGANQMLAAGKFAFFHQRTQLKAIDRFLAGNSQLELSRLGKKIAALKKSSPQSPELAKLQAALKKTQADRASADLWATPQPIPSAMILSGDHLILGQSGGVSAIDAATGNLVWKADVTGRVYGLAVANGRLFVSTDRGHIYSFDKNAATK